VVYYQLSTSQNYSSKRVSKTSSISPTHISQDQPYQTYQPHGGNRKHHFQHAPVLKCTQAFSHQTPLPSPSKSHCNGDGDSTDDDVDDGIGFVDHTIDTQTTLEKGNVDTSFDVEVDSISPDDSSLDGGDRQQVVNLNQEILVSEQQKDREAKEKLRRAEGVVDGEHLKRAPQELEDREAEEKLRVAEEKLAAMKREDEEAAERERLERERQEQEDREAEEKLRVAEEKLAAMKREDEEAAERERLERERQEQEDREAEEKLSVAEEKLAVLKRQDEAVEQEDREAQADEEVTVTTSGPDLQEQSPGINDLELDGDLSDLKLSPSPSMQELDGSES